VKLRTCTLPLLLAGLLCPGAHAAPADTLALARQVNAQIVHKQMREEVDSFSRTFNDHTRLPADVPAACRTQLQEAVTRMYAAMVTHLKAGVEEPEYQRALEQRLAEVYSSEQLKAFLARSASADSDTAALSAQVLAGPGLKAIQEAQHQKLLDGLDADSATDPALRTALRAAGAAKDACQRMQAEAG
jgi:hypothetical protein